MEKLKTLFDEYTLLEQIGQGGNGIVYKAVDSSKNEYAIKTVLSTKKNTIKKKRFKNEIMFGFKNQHKNIVEIIDYGTGIINDSEVDFYVMPLYCCTLKDKMREDIEPENIIKIFIGIIEGLKFAHEKGVIHRDIKPENILFQGSSYEPVICDFGIAHFSKDELATMVETKATDRLANFRYSAPEQRQSGGKVDYTTDLYSAGLILNQMFTKEVPCSADYKKIANVFPDYSYLDILFEHLFKQHQADRIQNARLVLLELSSLINQNEETKKSRQFQKVIEQYENSNYKQYYIETFDYDGEYLRFYLNDYAHPLWKNFLINKDLEPRINENYSSSKIIVERNRILCLKIIEGDDSNDTITRIVKSIKEWMDIANKRFVDYQNETSQRLAKEQYERSLKHYSKAQRIGRINNVLQELQ